MIATLRLLVLLGLTITLVGCPPQRRAGDDDDDSATGDDDDTSSGDDDDTSSGDDDDTSPGDDDDVVPGDSDGDGLPDDFEVDLGTDPLDADTDGDSYSDGEEYLSFFRPLDASDWPYIGGYPRGPIPEEVDGTGWEQGDASLDWSAEDQFGQELFLHRFYGNVVVVFVAAEWAPPCRIAAETVEAEWTARRDEGMVVLTLLIDGLSPGDAPDLERWVDDFGLTHPVLEDSAQDVTEHYVPSGKFGIPAYAVLDRQLNIVDWYQAGGEPDWSLVDDLLSEPAPDVDWPLP